MLLLIALTLKGSIAISPTPPIPTPSFGGGGGGGISHNINYKSHKETLRDNEREEREKKIEKILIEDSEIVQIVELTLRKFII